MNTEIEQLQEATDNLVNQQFYKRGRDIITGRTPEISIKIKNSGQIIQKYKDIFNSNIKLFLQGAYGEYLSNFTVIKGINQVIIKEISEKLHDKLDYLKDTTIDIVVLYTIVLSSIITRIRELHFNESLDEIKRRVQKKTTLDDEIIKEELSKLFMRNNNNISILYNLSYIDVLAESFNYKKVAHTCKIQKSKFMNHIVDIILSVDDKKKQI